MDTSAYLRELLSSFDANASQLNISDDSSANSISSPDQSSADFSDAANLLDQSSTTDLSFRSPPVPLRQRPVQSASATAAHAAEARDQRRNDREDDLRIKYEQLKKNFRKQGEELDRTTKNLDDCKHAASRDRSELEDRIRTVEHKHALLESQYQKSLLEFNHNLATKQTELTGAINSLRSTQLQLQDSNPDILKQIEYVKDDLTDLFISEPMYLEYSAIDRHRQTIREYVCCSVYELVRAEKGAKEAMHKELELIRSKFIKAEDECDRNARERDQIAKLKRSRENELQSELKHFETMNAKLQSELTKKTVQINELATKGEMYDALRLKAERLEEEYQLLQQKDLMNCISNKSLVEEKEMNSSKLFNLEKEKDLLRMDKMYLTKEAERLTECYRNSEKGKEHLEVKIVELKRSKEELVEKLVRVREEHQHSYEEKLNAELNRLQSRTASDLESIRSNQRDAFEREIVGLKESRDQLAKEHEKLRTSAENTREDYNTLQEEHRRLQSQLETERTDTRNALKLKAFEYERLSLTYEESMSDFRKLKIEFEVLGKKQSVLKQEFYTLQGDTQKRILELEASEKSLTEKLSMYQQLEYELDMAILNAGGVDEVQDKAALGSGQIRGIHHMLESLGSNVPTANKRRIKQSILLAQQLVQKQKQIEVLTKEITHYRDRNGELETELHSAKQSLTFVAQPHNYLIQSLQAKEEELLAANKKATSLSRALTEREEELKRAIILKTQLESDLHRLLAGKAQLNDLKDQLMRGQQAYLTNAPMVDQHAALQACKENLRPLPQQAPHPAFRQGVAVDERSFANINDPAHKQHQYQQQQQYPPSQPASHSRAHSYAPPTSSIPSHNQPLHSSHGRAAHPLSASGDPSPDAHPQPLWFRKLTR